MSNLIKAFSNRAARLTLYALTLVIVAISPHLASAQPQTTTPMPPELAARTTPPKSGDGTFDTPFFTATKEPVTLADFKGRGLVVNFWATWCPPCVREMPALDRLAKALKGSGVEVIAISEDRNAPKKVPSFLTAHDIKNLDFYFDIKGALSRKLGVQGLPTTVLITSTGAILGRVMGAMEWDKASIETYLRKALAPKK